MKLFLQDNNIDMYSTHNEEKYVVQKKYLLLKKLKVFYHEHVISDLNGEEIAGKFYEKALQITN